ncbi:MAG: patatin-like phospholipase family protein, partial [Spirochaetales bacterium]|nr:patatin-like phospholipase family protein [Spirochaetales bacterium]
MIVLLRIKKLIALIIVALAMFSLFSAERPTFALVLSGGGARGIAHIAVLEELEKRGIVPDLVVGTSIGALVGGFYSAGYTASELESLIIDTDIMALMMRFNNESGRISILSPDSNIEDNILALDFSNSGIGTNSGVLSDQELGSFLRRNLVKALPVDHFDNLSIPFRAIGIDAVTGEEIVFEDGSLFTAMRASMSLPVLFAPVKIDDGLYVMDGGMANNLPVDVARELGADYVLAVDVNDALNQNNYGMNEHMDTFSGSINAFTTVISITNSIPQYEIADWVLVPNVNDYSTIEFNSKLEILEKGRENVAANQDVFDELEKALEGREENRVTLYKDRPSYTIEVVDAAGLKSFEKDLNKFVGRALEKYT